MLPDLATQIVTKRERPHDIHLRRSNCSQAPASALPELTACAGEHVPLLQTRGAGAVRWHRSAHV